MAGIFRRSEDIANEIKGHVHASRASIIIHFLFSSIPFLPVFLSDRVLSATTSLIHIFPKKHWTSAGQCPRVLHRFGVTMDASYLSSTNEALEHFQVKEQQGLSEQQVQRATEKYGRNGTVHHQASSQEKTLLKYLHSITGRPSNAVMAACS